MYILETIRKILYPFKIIFRVQEHTNIVIKTFKFKIMISKIKLKVWKIKVKDISRREKSNKQKKQKTGENGFQS
jgi:hypothetical protein